MHLKTKFYDALIQMGMGVSNLIIYLSVKKNLVFI